MIFLDIYFDLMVVFNFYDSFSFFFNVYNIYFGFSFLPHHSFLLIYKILFFSIFFNRKKCFFIFYFTGSDVLNPAFIKFCKSPVRYHLVWSQHRGGQNLYCWEPVACSEAYVGLGMIATLSDTPPSLDAMQCVPKEWVRSKFKN